MARPRVLPDISIRQLEYLVAIADAPSWAAAADEVGVSPSALSQGLAELERRIGVPLFERDGRRRHLRPEATPVLDHARQVVALTADLAAWSHRRATGEQGEVRLGMIDAAAIAHYPKVVRRFRHDHPEVQLHLTVEPSAALLDRLTRGELDVVVCVEPPGPLPGIDAEPVLTEELAVYPPEGREAGDPATWGPWVLFPLGSHTRSDIAAALRRLGAPVEVVAESHQPEVLREMVRLDVGWTVLPRAQAEAGERPLRPARVLTTRRLVLARRTGAVVDPAADALAEALTRNASTPCGHWSAT